MPLGRSAMRLAELLSRLAHALASRAIRKQIERSADRCAGMRSLEGRAGLQRKARRLREVEHARADHDRRADGKRFDEVLPAERHEGAPDHRGIAGGEVERHLAHRVSQMELVAGTRHFSAGAARWQALCELFEALRMARDV